MLAPNSILQNRYRIVRLIGKGGMGAVFEAIDLTFDSAVAIKQTLVADDHFQKAFEREARLLNRLRHRALPVVTDYFFADEGEFLVMQFIAGDDLGAMLKKRIAQEYPQGIAKGFALGEVLNWADQLLDALEYLHSQNPPIIHRDIKPQNLKLNERGEIILLDFGLAKGAATSQSTAFTSIYGYTPSYAPLEQIQGSGTSIRSDLYSLAATVYNLITGVTPADALSRATAAIGAKPDPLSPVNRLNSKVPEAVAKVIMQGLAQNPEQRPHSATDMRKALREAANISSTKVSQKSDNAEKEARGNRIVVQLKPDSSLEQKPPAFDMVQQIKPSEYEKPVMTKQGISEDTQATLVRPTKKKTVLPDAEQTSPESPPESLRSQTARALRVYREKAEAMRGRAEGEVDRSAKAKEKSRITKSEVFLNPRRQEILELLVEGCSDEEIARRLWLSETQISQFLTMLRHDTGVITRKDLILWAMTQVASSGSRKTPETQRPKEATVAERKTVEPPVKTVPPNVRIEPPPPRPPKFDDANLFKPSEKKVTEIVAENEEQHSALGNFIGAIVLGFFAIGAAMTFIREIEKGNTKSFGEIAGIVILAGIALILGIACLGAILNFFAALKTK